MQTVKCNYCLLSKTPDSFYFSKGKISQKKCKECIKLKGKYIHGYNKPQDLANEIWEDIPNYEEKYQASNFGRIKSLERKAWNGKSWHLIPQRILVPSLNKEKYLRVGLCKNNKVIQRDVHQLVAMAFLNHKPNGFKIVVDHKDDNTMNNHLSNLQLITNRENVKKGFKKKNLTSIYPGVCFNKKENKFKSQIRIKHKVQVFLGYFKEEFDAYTAYEIAFNNINKYENNTQFRTLIKKLITLNGKK